MHMGLMMLGRLKYIQLSHLHLSLALLRLKLKKHKSPGFDHIPAELIQAGNITLHSYIQFIKFINSTWNMEELQVQGKESINCTFL
jgi:hypothetical protein